MPHSEVTTEISKDWDRLDCDKKFRTLYVIGGQDSVVERSSASRVKGVNTETIADKGHIQIVKPQHRTDISYLIVKRAIQGDSYNTSPILPPKNLRAGQIDVASKPGRGRSLFDQYALENEPYYINRREDYVIKNYMEFQNLWVWGPSGYGKTSALIRALLLLNCEYRVVSLGHYAGEPAQSIFLGIVDELGESRSNISINAGWPAIISEAASRIEHLINYGCKWIMIEEIPFDDGEQYIALVSKLMLVIQKTEERNGSGTIGFLFSSIKDPTKSVKFVPKMRSAMKILQLGTWRNCDAIGLIESIKKDTQTDLTDQEVKNLLHLSNNSPRMIKIFYINFLSLKNMGGNFRDAIVDTFEGAE